MSLPVGLDITSKPNKEEKRQRSEREKSFPGKFYSKRGRCRTRNYLGNVGKKQNKMDHFSVILEPHYNLLLGKGASVNIL